MDATQYSKSRFYLTKCLQMKIVCFSRTQNRHDAQLYEFFLESMRKGYALSRELGLAKLILL